MKLMINVIGIITVIVCTILGLFLIPFFSWLTGFGWLLAFLFIVGCIGLFVTFVGFIRYKSKSCKKVNVLLVTLYASLSIIIPSTILLLTKYNDFWVRIDGNLTKGYSSWYYGDGHYGIYTKFGVRKFGYDIGELYYARDGYGQRYYVVWDRNKDVYNLYDCNGETIGYGYSESWDILDRKLKDEYGLSLD